MWVNDNSVKCPCCECYVDKSEMIYSEWFDGDICSYCYEDNEEVAPTAIETTSNVHPMFDFILKSHYTALRRA